MRTAEKMCMNTHAYASVHVLESSHPTPKARSVRPTASEYGYNNGHAYWLTHITAFCCHDMDMAAALSRKGHTARSDVFDVRN